MHAGAPVKAGNDRLADRERQELDGQGAQIESERLVGGDGGERHADGDRPLHPRSLREPAVDRISDGQRAERPGEVSEGGRRYGLGCADLGQRRVRTPRDRHHRDGMHEGVRHAGVGRAQRAKTFTAERDDGEHEGEWRQRQTAPVTQLEHHQVGDPGADQGAEAERRRKPIAAEVRIKTVEHRDHCQPRHRRVPG